MIKTLLVAAAMAFGLSLGLAGSANAALFTLSNDNGGDGYVVGIPGGFDLFGADNGVGSNTTTYLATAAANETLKFSWIYTTNDCCGSYWDPAGYVLNGVSTQLSVDMGGSPGTGDASGSVTLSVLAGQNYGFYVWSRDSCCGRADIAVTAVPEPSTWILMLLGFAGLGFAGYRRVRMQAPALSAA